MRYIGLLTIVFFTLLTIEVYGEINQDKTIMWYSKPLLMPTLIILFMLNGQKHWPIERICSILALIFSCLGDISLLKHREHLFMYGLVSFLTAHVSYIILFLAQIYYQRGGAIRFNRVPSMLASSIPFIAYIAFILYILYPRLTAPSEKSSSLLIPVVLYTIIIVAMAYVSYLRSPNSPGYWIVFIGALVFILSDSILAYDKFVKPLSIRGLHVMTTYGIAQYLITVGTLKATSKTSKNL